MMDRFQQYNEKLFQDPIKTQDIALNSSNFNQIKKDKYKPLFCDTSFYLDHQPQFKIINSTLKNAHLCESQKVIVWIIFLSILRRPQSWYGGSKKNQNVITVDSDNMNLDFTNSVKNFDLNFDLKDLFLKLSLFYPPLSKTMNCIDFLLSVKINPLPAVVHRSLVKIFLKKYPVKVLNYEPDPVELLKIQSQGFRVITFNSNFTEWPQLLYGARDPLSFWIHDCIHADHFFNHNFSKLQQMGFYKWMYKVLKDSDFKLEQTSEKFKSDFSYLISDMNSHPLHLVKTLKALIFIHLGSEAPQVWNIFLNHNNLSLPEIFAFNLLNTHLFQSEHSLLIMTRLEGLGADSHNL